MLQYLCCVKSTGYCEWDVSLKGKERDMQSDPASDGSARCAKHPGTVQTQQQIGKTGDFSFMDVNERKGAMLAKVVRM